MPVTYEIDKRNGIIRTRCSGAVTFPDVVEHFQTLERDADCPRSADVVLDLRELTSLPTNNQLRSVGDQIHRIRNSVRFGLCAIVASSDAVYGTARVFEVFAAAEFRATNVFRWPIDAETWLAEQRAPVN